MELRVDHWSDKQATRDAVRLAVYDYLYDERTGLPAERYGEDEVEALAGEVFRHVFVRYLEGIRPGVH